MEAPPPGTPLSNYPRPGLDPDRQVLKEVAVSQRQIMLCVLGQISIGILNGVAGAGKIPLLYIFDFILAIGVLVLMILSVLRLAKALGLSEALYVVLMFIPCVSLIVLLSLSGRATKLLQQAGIKVGFLGADPNSI